MSEIRDWPQCAECSLREAAKARVPAAWWPVEAYQVDESPPRRRTARTHLTVIARCSHGSHDGPGPQRFEQTFEMDVPYWWGPGHVRDAIRKLRFFMPGDARSPADHGLVVDIT